MAPQILGTPAYTAFPISTPTLEATSPTGIQLGESLLCAIKINSGSNHVDITNLNGWTLLWEHPAPSLGDAYLLVKDVVQADVDNAGTSAYYDFPINNTSFPAQVAIFRASGISHSLSDSDTVNVPSSSASNIPALTSAQADSLALWFASANDPNSWTFSTGTEFFDQNAGTNRSFAGAWAVVPSGNTAQNTITPSVTTNIVGFGFILPPALGSTEELRPDAILLQTNDTKTLANLQRDVP